MSTNTLTCPKCGKQYTVNNVQGDAYYINGMHNASVKQMFDNLVLCDCEMLCAFNMDGVDTKITDTEEYQKILNASFDSETERKIALLNILFPTNLTPLYLAHYYDEQNIVDKRIKALQQCIQQILDGTDTLIYNMCGLPMVSYGYSIDLYLEPEARLVDLYRCTGDFANAKQQIKKLWKIHAEKPRFAWPKYLHFEEKLIKQKNTSFQ